MLNKPTEEVNKEKNNEEINYNEDNIYHGRFKIDDLDEEDEKEKEDNINNITIIIIRNYFFYFFHLISIDIF